MYLPTFLPSYTHRNSKNDFFDSKDHSRISSSKLRQTNAIMASVPISIPISLNIELAATGDRFLVGDFDHREILDYDLIHRRITDVASDITGKSNASIILEEDEAVLTTPCSHSYHVWNKFASRLIRTEVADVTVKIMLM